MPDVQSQTPDPASPAQAAPDSGPDPLANLYKMSTTSAGGGEYVAINATSIVSLLLGIASIVAMLTDALLIVPLAGFICAIVAMIQIRRSNGTQSGVAFAIIGLLLSLLIGGARAGQQLAANSRSAKDTQIIAGLIERFGQDVHLGRYNELYDDMMTKAFRDQMDRATFAATLERFQKELGQIDSIEWNGVKPYYEDVGTSGVHSAYAVGLTKFHNSTRTARPEFTFSDREGTWKCDEMSFVPTGKKKKRSEQ